MKLFGRYYDSRRLYPMIVILVFMGVTIGHVAEFTGSFESQGWQFLGWLYAIAVDASILICSYFTKWKTTQRWAWTGYFIFVAASGAMNVASVEPYTLPFSRAWSAWVYSILPTISISLLGFLYGQVEGLVQSRERSRNPGEKKATPKPKTPTIPEWAIPHQCWCGWWPGKDKNATSLPEHHAQMIGGHTRRHYREAKASESILKALAFYKETYPDALSYPDGTTIAKWRKDDITS